MNVLIKALILSILPISELRGGIPLAIGLGANPFLAFIVCVLANILVIPFIFLFLDYLHEHFMKIRIYKKFFELYLNRLRRKVGNKLDSWQYWVLFLFVAIPSPGTGAYTGCLIAWFFKMNRKNSFITIALGVLTAGIIVTLVSMSLFKLF